jgi:hypothetical protein
MKRVLFMVEKPKIAAALHLVENQGVRTDGEFEIRGWHVPEGTSGRMEVIYRKGTAQPKRREKQHKERFAKLERIIERAPEVLNRAQLRTFTEYC